MEESIKNVDISIIVPIFNGEKWIDQCFNSILDQTILEKGIHLEVSVYNDASADNTDILLEKWKRTFENKGVSFVMQKNLTGSPRGAGYGKNAAIRKSNGDFLCFQDIDDVMLPSRLWEQYNAAKSRKDTIIGSKFHREPPDSTERYTKWANNLTQEQLDVQVYTSHGPTIILPTWFFHRSVFERVGGFSEKGTVEPEDLVFFYDHLDKGGKIYRVDDYLVIYTYHKDATTFSITSDSIWDIRVERLQKIFLPKCHGGFTIWNGGKQGKKLFKSLNSDMKNLAKAMCDVDVQKIGKLYEMYCPIQRKVLHKIPIIHYKDAETPLIICVKLDLTNGEFEDNLKSLNLIEGADYILFS